MMPEFLIKEPDYVTLHWNAGERGLVGLDATAVALEDGDFEIAGTTCSDGDCVNNDDFGLTLKTVTAGDEDQCILQPAAAVDNRSLFREINWGPENETEFECVVKTETLANADIYIIGLMLTFPATYDAAVDADQVIFSYLEGTDTNWTVDANIGNVDVVAYDTGVTVVANNTYHFRIAFDKERRVHCFINGNEVYVGNQPMTRGAAFLPCVGVEAGSAAESMLLHVSKIAMRRKWGVN
jgi:hypothetical protein